MQEPVGPLRRPGLRRLFTPRSASLLAAGVTVAALGAAGLNATATTAPAPPAASAHVWITTADGADKLSDLGTVGFSTAPSSAPTVVVDGLDYLRQPIGGSDTVATVAYTYDDVPAGTTDYDMRHFTVAHDQAEILPLLREAKALNPRLRIIASPWSPPA
jgi:glucosylceramidase